MQNVSIFLISFSVFVIAVNGANIYVSKSGNDDNSGSPSSPFRTITRAQLAARQVRISGPLVTVIINEGTYFLGDEFVGASPLVFLPQDSGTSYIGVGDVRISGGFAVNTSWVQEPASGIWSTTLEEPSVFPITQLFVNERRQTPARSLVHTYVSANDTQVLTGTVVILNRLSSFL